MCIDFLSSIIFRFLAVLDTECGLHVQYSVVTVGKKIQTLISLHQAAGQNELQHNFYLLAP